MKRFKSIGLIFFLVLLWCTGRSQSLTDVRHQTERVEYKTACCPAFELAIDENRHAVFETDDSVYFKMRGTYECTIDSGSFLSIFYVVNHMDLSTMDSTLGQPAGGQRQSTLKITYDNGKIKCITDYGLRGTGDLQKVYDLLFKLTIEQSWKRVY